ncbi:hypothetical protein SASPL_134912 [Salvia splendens]|uniref:ArsA/GET3 Anion-transporting ATPase-like domain-containing protein n=1 Tax=Salvia splendens TaxID=180675 RepID=A0A8X8WZ63_SALSN|nr:hypothetical protein SASPL_134912 [Salvia splendens]
MIRVWRSSRIWELLRRSWRPEGMEVRASMRLLRAEMDTEGASKFKIRWLVQTMDYSVIVFDTAPTGHTLRLLQFPSTLEKGLSKLMSLRNKFGGLFTQVLGFSYISSLFHWRSSRCFMQMTRMFGVENDFGEDDILGKLEGMKDVIEQVNRQFKDPFRSLPAVESKLLKARMQMQRKYLDQFYVLYDDFNTTRLPLLPQEVYYNRIDAFDIVLQQVIEQVY